MRKFYLLVVFSVGLLSGAWAQERTVSGQVTTADDGSPLPGVTVVVKGTTTGTITGTDGTYNIAVSGENNTLVFSFIGYATQEIAVGNRSTIDITMREDVTELGEVVVTALGISREEKSLGYSVQEVGGDVVSRGRETNITNALSGVASGVHIKQSNTMGGSANILIRGINSLTGNNQPLWVVDGVPIDNRTLNSSGQSTARGGYDYGNLAMDINPDDIESVSVLKGASAAALYGNRAANGVVLVTTKKGKSQVGLGLTWNSSVNFSTVNKATMPKHQYEYGAGYGQYYEDATGYFFEADVDGDGTDDLIVPTSEDASWGHPLDGTMVVHWDALDPLSPNYGEKRPYSPPEVGFEDGWFETGVQFNNSFAFSGGNESTTFRFSYNNTNDKGIMPWSHMDRNKASFNGMQHLNDKLKVETSVNFTRNEARGRAGTGYHDFNVMQSFGQWFQSNLDFKRLKDGYVTPDGRHMTWNRLYWNTPTPIYFNNPFWVRDRDYQNDDRTRFYGFVRFTYDIADWLSVSYRPAGDFYTDFQEERIAVGGVSVSDYTQRTRTNREVNHEFLARFNHDFPNEFSIQGLVGSNLRNNYWTRNMKSTRDGLIVADLYSISNSISSEIQQDDRVFELAQQSVFGQLSFGIKNMVFVDLTARNDWSSTLPKENNSYFYPSASVSWIFSELPGLSTSDVFSFGKLRASFAEVGNDTGPYNTSNYYSSLANFGDAPLYSLPSTLNNPQLKPETQRSYELGFDVRFLEDRIGLDLTAYQTSTFDQILPVRTSVASGYSFKFINAGEIENKGIEIALTSTPVNTGDFRWDLNLNWAKNENTVVSLSEDIENYQLGSHFFITLNAAVGEPYGTWKGTDFVYHDNGQPIVESNGIWRRTEGNQEVLGSYLPDWTGGIINNFSYKNLRLTSLIDIQQGGSFYSNSLMFGRATGLYAETAGLNAQGNPKRDPVSEGGGILLDGVQEDGTPNTVYAPASDFFGRWYYGFTPAAEYILDASYVKLRQLTLSYDLPQSVIGNTPFQSLSVGFVGRNLAILHKNTEHSDPEANSSAGNVIGLTSGDYPSVRQYGFNLTVGF